MNSLFYLEYKITVPNNGRVVRLREKSRKHNTLGNKGSESFTYTGKSTKPHTCTGQDACSEKSWKRICFTSD
jgi:hypothetical protein